MLINLALLQQVHLVISMHIQATVALSLYKAEAGVLLGVVARFVRLSAFQQPLQAIHIHMVSKPADGLTGQDS